MSFENENKELLKYPNYLLSTYQLEIYKQLGLYMQKYKLKKGELAEEMKVSNAYVSQILNGQFNFTLKKLIELGIAIKKVPYLEFIDESEYWRREKEGTIKEYVYTVTTEPEYKDMLIEFKTLNDFIDISGGGKLPNKITVTQRAIKNKVDG